MSHGTNEEAQHGGTGNDLAGGRIDRRSLIKKAGVAGVAAWVAPVVIDSMISPAGAASLAPGVYALRLSTQRCDPTPVLDPSITFSCLPPDWGSATLTITDAQTLADLGLTVSNCSARYALQLTSSNANVTILSGTSCKPSAQGGGPNPGVVAADGSSITWDGSTASDRNGYYIVINVA